MLQSPKMKTNKTVSSCQCRRAFMGT